MRELTKDAQAEMMKEQFIPDHLFIYLVRGSASFFDGSRSYHINEGECCLIRKNCLLKFILSRSEGSDHSGFEPVFFCFDEPFLRQFQEKHRTVSEGAKPNDSVIPVLNNAMMSGFIRSLEPYYKGEMLLDEAFEDLKYEELLIILLKYYPELTTVLFDFTQPEKINLEAFMNKNFTFNVSMERFAFLTGRSLSAFKRDFKAIFQEAPGRWLVQKRVEEARFLLTTQGKKPSDIYLDLGFETLSHFSVAFKRVYKISPTAFVAGN